ncbi:MAG: DUF416 family protein [Lachnospiraceae bacterium]|nr:DUF416 family protein [Lachnospiraceae bacterium]
MDFLDQYKIENERQLSEFTQKQKRILVLMCLERQFKTYMKFAAGKVWNRSEQYRELFDTCWNIVLNEQNVDDKIWYFHEEIRPDKVCAHWDEDDLGIWIAGIFSTHVEEWLDYLIDEQEYEESFRLLILDFILVYLNGDNDFEYDKYEHHPFIVNEMEQQLQDEMDMKNIFSFEDAKRWYSQCECIF